MFAKMFSYPPLGQATVITADKGQVPFTVFLEANADDLEVELWNNAQGDWAALPLSKSDSDKTFRSSSTTTSIRHTCFEGVVRKPSSNTPVNFTLRCRQKGQQQWKWANEAGNEDGTLIFQSEFEEKKLEEYFDGMASGISVQEQHSDTPSTQLWSLSMPVDAAKGEASGWSWASLGTAKSYSRWFALVRLWSPWIGPRHGRPGKFATEDAIQYTFLRDDGLHVVALAVSGVDDVMTVFQDAGDGSVKVVGRNDREEKGVSRVIVAVGNTFDTANAAAMYYARHLVSELVPVQKELAEAISNGATRTDDDLKANWVQSWYDGFTYCTWNGLGQDLTEQKILTVLESLHSSGINIVNLIIDDNWQSLDRPGKSQFLRGMTDFEANKEAFPNGISHAATTIREKYPHIQHIGVWHAILGYWGGISPTGSIAKEYTTRRVKHNPRGPMRDSFYVIDASDISRFYNDFYGWLVTNGITAVKTDAQFALDEIDDAPSRRAITQATQDAWTTAQLRHCYGTAISCMSQTPPILFHSQLPTNRPAVVVRNSDDFSPVQEDSHPWHIFCNAHAALFTKHLNVLPDWDMFQTHHHWSGFHAAARVISGGPVYITDEPGKHNIPLIKQLTARTIQGQTVVLRPDVVGRSANVYTAYEEDRLCRITAYNGHAQTGASFMGCFNIRDRSIAEAIPFDDFLGCDLDQTYLVRAFRSGDLSLASAGNVEALRINAYDWEILTAVPVRSVKTNSDTIELANLGLCQLMSGAAGITGTDEVTTSEDGSRAKLRSSLKALGVWGVWLSREHVEVDQLFALVSGQPAPVSTVSVENKPGNGSLVYVDVEKAWHDLDLDARFSNEVVVTLFIAPK